MFRHEGPSRSPRKNAELAGYLALVAGYVNSSGFILIGSFTSHVTGNVGRLSNDVALGGAPAALFARDPERRHGCAEHPGHTPLRRSRAMIAPAAAVFFAAASAFSSSEGAGKPRRDQEKKSR